MSVQQAIQLLKDLATRDKDPPPPPELESEAGVIEKLRTLFKINKSSEG